MAVKLSRVFRTQVFKQSPQRTDQAMRSRSLLRRSKLARASYRDEIFPSKPPIQNVPREYILISVGRRMKQRGSVKLRLMFGLAGAAPGFFGGSIFQFGQLKEFIAKNTGVEADQLRYLDFLTDPTVSLGDWGSVVIAGVVGAFFTGTLASGLPQLISQSNNNPGGN